MKKFTVKLTLPLLLSTVLILSGFTLEKNDFIKWVDFNAGFEIMQRAYEIDLESFQTEKHIKFTDTLAYLTALNGNKFRLKTDLSNLSKLMDKLNTVDSIDEILGENKYYIHYKQVYSAIFSGFFNRYMKNDTVEYGLVNYHPIAAGFGFSESDDFGNSRAFGFKRRHLGHDLFGSVGTPIIAMESGIVTEMGWNRYGGWRIGVTSNDGMRYYYYAHLRKNKPFHPDIVKGENVRAGQVIGYMGMTGYSVKENVNMKTNPHLHFGMQLIFDESQRSGNSEIWIDVYQICRFLYKNRAKTVKNPDTNERDSIDLITSKF